MATNGPATPHKRDFEEHFTSYGGRIRAYVLGLVREPAEADDLTQGHLCGLDTLRDAASVSSWLYRVATNLVSDRLRAMGSPPDRPLSDGADEPEASDDCGRVARLDALLARSEMSDCVQHYELVCEPRDD